MRDPLGIGEALGPDRVARLYGDGSGMAYARPPVADEAGLGDYYSGYLDRHKNDNGFDATI